MPLSTPGPREPIHTRQIHCQGFRREDGLWEIEGYLRDQRAFAHHNHWGDKNLGPEVPVHEMWMRLTLDENKVIVAVETSMEHIPFPPHCAEVRPNYQALVGIKIAAGFRKRVHTAVGGALGCTHVNTLLQNLATTAFQAMSSDQLRAVEDPAANVKPKDKLVSIFHDGESGAGADNPLINSCYAHSEHSPVMAKLWPALYKGPATKPVQDAETNKGA